jgi:hypothetical protein
MRSHFATLASKLVSPAHGASVYCSGSVSPACEIKSLSRSDTQPSSRGRHDEPDETELGTPQGLGAFKGLVQGH